MDDKDLLGIWQEATGQGDDGLRKVMETAIQRILEKELTSFLKCRIPRADRNEGGYRNGYKPRALMTRLGRMEFAGARDREGLFQTELFDRYQRNEKALMLSLVEMYVHGVYQPERSRRSPKPCAVLISPGARSCLAKGLDEEVRAWRSPPDGNPIPTWWWMPVMRRSGSIIRS